MSSPGLMSDPQITQRKAYVETYGCQMNISDGELMQGILAAAGYELTDSPETADVVLVNTCAIRDHAEQRVIGRVGDLYRHKIERPDLVIGVTGCMAQRIGRTLLEQAPYVDLVMGPDGYRDLADTLAAIRPGSPQKSLGRPQDAVSVAGVMPRRSLPVLAMHSHDNGRTGRHKADRAAVLELRPEENYEGLEVRRSSRVSAWVPIQRGCNHRCTYCIVPYVRGNEKNRDYDRILDEVRAIAQSGITEVTLLGQTVNSWNHGDRMFPDLLRAVARVDGIRRVRFTSPHPNDVTPELIEVMALEPAVCQQLHLPVQSGHDRTLKRMLRRYTAGEYLDTVRRVRNAMPDIALSTDVIVAFPGESDAEYEATLDLLREVRYDDAFLYRYSPRDGTPATRLPAGDFVADDVARDRLDRLIALHRSIQAEINESEVGSEVDLLIEREARSPGDMLGRSDRLKVAAVPGDETLVNRYVRARLTSTTGSTFRAERIGSAAQPGLPAPVA